MKILGISHPISLNPAAALIIDGKLIAFAEEERFNRIKHSINLPAFKSIEYCLEEGRTSLDELDYIGIGSDNYLTILFSNILGKTFSLIKNKFSPYKIKPRVNINWITTNTAYGIIQPFLSCYQGLLRLPFNWQDKRVRFIRHHMAHIASTYYSSGMKNACIISIDGSGGQESGILAVGNEEKIKILKRIPINDSLGFLYGVITEFLGFDGYDGPGKVMGLSSYADKNVKIFPFVYFQEGFMRIDKNRMISYLNQLNGKLSKNPLDKPNRNIAGSLQKTIEQAYIYMAKYLYKQTGIKNFCLTGGVSLNCLANTQVLSQSFVDNVYIQPASNDAGTALGAALAVYTDILGKRPAFTMNHAYWGPEFSNDQILKVIKRANLPFYKKESNIEKKVAKYLSERKIIGWFQGRMEVGPRALGNRSILANPSVEEMKDLVNLKVKGREKWRPFAPSILEEYAKDYLIDTPESPFMILSSRVNQKKQRDIIAAIHIDKTVRPQTVSKRTNLRYWNLINEFYKISGIPVLLNTSFNLAGEPVVCTPQDAIAAFFRTDIDYLILNNYIISKHAF